MSDLKIEVIQKPDWMLRNEFLEACENDLLTIKVPVGIAYEIVYLMTDNDVLYDNRIALCDDQADALGKIRDVGASLESALAKAKHNFENQVIE